MGKHKKKETVSWGKVQHRPSVKPVTEKDLEYVKSYQNGLVDFLCYETSSKKEAYKQGRILKEIGDVEMWLKKHYQEFINSKNTKFEHA